MVSFSVIILFLTKQAIKSHRRKVDISLLVLFVTAALFLIFESYKSPVTTDKVKQIISAKTTDNYVLSDVISIFAITTLFCNG